MARPVFVVVTTIHAPTAAVAGFCRRFGDRVIVVGDRKTPADWSHPPVEYLGPEDAGGRLAAALPWNHYSRKMLGYIRAASRGAGVIYDTDDDNVAKPEWAIPAFDGAYACTGGQLGFVNVYAHFTRQHVWPRGFPLTMIRDGTAATREHAPQHVRVGVWQALADGDPDVDAVYRLVDGRSCTFTAREPLVLGAGTLCPFNTQATAVRRELFPLLYLPSTVSFRFTDILRGLVAQPIMWRAGFRLGFTQATVVQSRNPHDLLADLADELPMYRAAAEVPDLVGAAIRADADVSANLVSAYEALASHGIVQRDERGRLDAWLEELRTAAAAAA